MWRYEIGAPNRSSFPTIARAVAARDQPAEPAGPAPPAEPPAPPATAANDEDAFAVLHARNAQLQVVALIESAADAASAAPPGREIERAQALLAVAARLAGESLETLEALARRLDRRPPAARPELPEDAPIGTWEQLVPAGPVVASGRPCALALVEDPPPRRTPRGRRKRRDPAPTPGAGG